MVRTYRAVALTALILTASSCHMVENAKAGGEAVKQFHERFDSEQYATIYAEADEELQKQTSQKEFIAILSAVHRKLGMVKQASSTGYFINANTDGTFVKLTYKTSFPDSDATETFTWRMAGGKCKLIYYNIESTALIIR